MKIKSNKVFIEKSFAPAVLEFSDKIEGLSATMDAETIDFGDDYIIPGLIDIHTHGGAGGDFSDGDAAGIHIAARHYARHGVTGFLATTMTIPEVELTGAMQTIKEFTPGEGEAKCLGIHLEGPFVSSAKKGAQAESAIHRPNTKMWERLNSASGNKVKMVTVAPEEDGGIEFVREISKHCVVSLGHTNADYETAMEAFAAGASHVTHLFNQMPAINHRAPGVIAAALDAGASAELICDGLHIAPAVVRLAYKLFGEKLNIISDSLRCAGLPDGDYELGGQPITLSGGVARLSGSETLAGSAITSLDGLRNFVSFGLPLEAAVYAASTAPARAAGLTGVGELKAGNAADFIVLDKNLALKAVYISGKCMPECDNI